MSDDSDLVVYETEAQRRERIARQNSLYEWRKKRSRNRARTQSVRSEVMCRANQQCEICRFDFWCVLNVHHIVPVSQGGSARRKNLISLCPNCHALIHHYGNGVHDPSDPDRVRGVMSAGYTEKQALALLLVASRRAAVRDDGTIYPYRAPEDKTRYVLIESEFEEAMI